MSKGGWNKARSILHALNARFTGRYALYYNTFGGALLFTTGDAIQQKLEIKSGVISKFDYKRTARVGIVGLIEGPPHFLFYKYLEALFPGRGSQSITSKIFVDQFIACPSFHFLYFMGMALLEGKTLQESWQELVRKFPTVYAVDWLLWPPLQILNFYFVPPLYRVLVINCITVLWNVFLSFMKHFDQFDNKDCCKLGTCDCMGPNYAGNTGSSQISAFFHQVKRQTVGTSSTGTTAKETELPKNGSSTEPSQPPPTSKKS